MLDVAAWPYILLGCGYASLAVGLLLVGAQRQRELEHALRTGGYAPLRSRTVALFTVGGVALAGMTLGARGDRADLKRFSVDPLPGAEAFRGEVDTLAASDPPAAAPG